MMSTLCLKRPSRAGRIEGLLFVSFSRVCASPPLPPSCSCASLKPEPFCFWFLIAASVFLCRDLVRRGFARTRTKESSSRENRATPHRNYNSSSHVDHQLGQPHAQHQQLVALLVPWQHSDRESKLTRPHVAAVHLPWAGGISSHICLQRRAYAPHAPEQSRRGGLRCP
jgi:hypothetical protein